MTIVDFPARRQPRAKKKIAVIGSGVAGLGAAWALRDTADVTLFEKRDRLGGHSCTVNIDYDGKTIPVDVGFIVFTPRQYPNLTALFHHLDVETQPTKMSFGYSEAGGIEWCSNLLGFAAQKRNMFRPSHLGMIADMVRFCLTAKRDLARGRARGIRLCDYLDQRGYGKAFQDRFLLPMAGAIWSASADEMKEQEAEAFLEFFAAHGLTDFERPEWRTVAGGSRNYVNRIARALEGRIVTNAGIKSVRRTPAGVTINFTDGPARNFDDVILACHADQARALLADADQNELDFLNAIPFRKNRVVLHRDPSLAPDRDLALASWNSRREHDSDAAYVTYDMNQLQHIDPDKPVFVTLNPTRDPDPALTFAEFEFDHPGMSSASIAARRRFNQIQGVRNTWFAGAWLGYGFHEDGLTTGLRAALRLGGSVPWDFTGSALDGGPIPAAALDADAARIAAQ